jgi:nuclear protein localization family protein 4
VQDFEDNNRYKVDMIANALTLERVGVIFTSINNDTFLDSEQIREISKMQEAHKIDHPAGCNVSKQITVVIKPKGDGTEMGIECYMVSDQCQAMERDNCFGHSNMRKKMVLRETGPDDMVPQVLQEGKPVIEFDPDFFIVSLAHGQPKKDQDFSILKNYRFPVENRDKQSTVSD